MPQRKHTRRIALAVLIGGLVAPCLVAPSYAEVSNVISNEHGNKSTKRLIVRIDARSNPRQAAKEFHELIALYERDPKIRSLTLVIRLFVDGAKGMDMGLIRIPYRLRRVRLIIRITVTRGALRRDLNVTQLDLRTAPLVRQVNQQLRIY